ncbi:MAG: transporter substrate-binding domain-containing protein [Prolixibacteraceae bacterium]|nr:transporter substrate-binding domain-containing protein [Prolixibacteraceae bacterium]
MKVGKTILCNLFLILIFLFSAFSCKNNSQPFENKDPKEVKPVVLQEILKKKKLRAVVDYNSTNYFVYKAVPMGFEYELLQELAKKLDVRLEIVVSNNLAETFDGLQKGRFDLVAKNLTITKERSEFIDFTVPLEQTRQVLVQRLPENWEDLSEDEINNNVIRSQLDLAGKTIYVQKNTAYYERLKNLSDEIGHDINIVEDTIYGVEKLVGLVANGEIDYTICDENVAMVNKTYYPNIDIFTPVSFKQNIAWAVKKGSDEWLNYLNDWITDFKETVTFRILYQKYFLSSRSKYMVASDYHSITGGRISKYDEMIKKIAGEKHWDWRLISSIIFVESKFSTEADSWSGAQGLMQLMPTTAEFYKVEDVNDPEQNVEGGVSLLSWLDGYFKPTVTDSTERIKFVLAAFNVGLGHIKDAQRLARKYGKNPHIWKDNVDYFLLNKSLDKYIKDPEVKWGYCRGEEPYNYVQKVLHNYQNYSNVIPL